MEALMSVLAAHVLGSRPIKLMVTTALVASMLVRFGPTARLLPYAWLAIIAVPLAAADLTTRRLPNHIILPSYPVVFGLLGVAAFADHSLASLQRALLGMALTLTLYGIPYLLAPNAIGGGDIKLAGLLGLVLASASWHALLNGTMLAWLLATVTVLLLRITSHPHREIPLSPVLLTGACIALLTVPGI
jgi:leader peptidase (prepilin peptidase)/N-methyltransferase